MPRPVFSRFRPMVRAALLAGLFISAACHPLAASAQTEEGYQSYLQELRARAQREGISPTTISQVFPTLTMSERVIELDRAQPGGSSGSTAIPPFAPYRAKHVDAARISRGQAKYRANRSKLAAIEQKTGVPESIMVAIWGHETNYGAYTGDFDLLRSLSTLAYEGRRRQLFADEFIATLKMMDRGIPRSQLVGSWAGATGYPQFLPSVYLRLGKDGDGDGRANIWSSEADALASIANYFVNAGWRPGQPWGVPVSVPRNLDMTPLVSRTNPTRCPRVFERHSRWLTMREWRSLGVVPVSGRTLQDDVQATLIEPDGRGNTAYLLTSNYRVILDYNCSNFYALSVGVLADEVER